MKMFEDKTYDESDLMMRSVLENAEEEVPSGVWESISEGLDKASRKKTVVIMWRRAAVGIGVAAALAVGLFLNHGVDEDIIYPSSDDSLIAVVEKEESISEESDFGQDILIAQVLEVEDKKEDRLDAVSRIEEEVETEAETVAETENEIQTEKKPESKPEPSESKDNLTYQYKEEYIPFEWEEESSKDRRKNASIVLSGLAGTNSVAAGAKSTGLLRQPSISTAPPKTGIKETSTNSIYGIPLSIGAGVKIDLTRRWSVGVGINYTYLTRRFYGSYTKVDDHGNIETAMQSDIRNSQHYIGIPVNVFYDIVESKRLSFYAYAGGAVEKGLSDKYNLIGTNVTHMEKVKGVQLSANLGIGVEFLLGRHLGLYIDPSLRYYFDNGQPSSIRTAQPLMAGFEMGLRVNL